MKAFGKIFYWFLLPGVFALAISTGDQRYAQAGAALLWGSAILFGPLMLIVLLGSLAVKPGGEKWDANREKFLKNRSGTVVKVIGWFALIATVALAAFTGFIVSAVFYLAAMLWVRLAWAMCVFHFERAETK